MKEEIRAQLILSRRQYQKTDAVETAIPDNEKTECKVGSRTICRA